MSDDATLQTVGLSIETPRDAAVRDATELVVVNPGLHNDEVPRPPIDNRAADFQELVGRAGGVAIVTAVSAQSRFSPGTSNDLDDIVTDVTVRVERALRGSVPQVVTFRGGTVDGQSMWISEVPHMLVGNAYVIMTHPNGDSRLLFAARTFGSEFRYRGLVLDTSVLGQVSEHVSNPGGADQ